MLYNPLLNLIKKQVYSQIEIILCLILDNPLLFSLAFQLIYLLLIVKNRHYSLILDQDSHPMPINVRLLLYL